MAAAAGAGANSSLLKVSYTFQNKTDFLEKLSDMRKQPVILFHNTRCEIHYMSSSGDPKPRNHSVSVMGGQEPTYKIIDSIAQSINTCMAKTLEMILVTKDPNPKITKYVLFVGITIPVKVVREEAIEEETQRPLASTIRQEQELTFEAATASAAGRAFFEGKDFLGEGS